MLSCFVKKLFLVVLATLLLLGFSACVAESAEVCIFSDLSECKAIAQTASDGATVDIYNSPNGDEHLEEAEYADFFACKYSGEFEFVLYAYEFVDSDTAKAYYQRVTSLPCEKSYSYSSVAGMRNYERTVIQENLVYTVQCNRSDADRVTAFLTEVFTYTLPLT